MIKHIVMWRLKETAEGASKLENAAKMKEMLEALKIVIPQIQNIEVGMNVVAAGAAYDVALYSEFASLDDLDIYQKHPDHEVCKQFIGKIVSERAFVDYEV